MKRAPHQLPYSLSGLQRNIQTGLYEITEDGICYAMDLESTRLLKIYCTDNPRNKISEWHSSIDAD